MTQTFTLPWPPSVNTYWRHVGSRVLLSREGRDYRRRVANELFAQKARHMTGRLAVVVCLDPPDRRKRDIDNPLKAILDALQHAGLYADDSQVDWLSVRRREPCPPGAAVVLVYEMEGEEADRGKAG